MKIGTISEIRLFIKGLNPQREIGFENGKLILLPDPIKIIQHSDRKVDWEECWRLYKKGLGQQEISQKLGTTRQNIQHILKTIKMRNIK